MPRIDFRAIAHDPGNDAKPRGHARGGRIDRHVEGGIEHRGIEFAGGAIDVAIGAGKIRRDHGRAQTGDAGEQFVHESVFGAAQGEGVQPAFGDQAVGIVAAGMARGEDEGQGLDRGPEIWKGSAISRSRVESPRPA